jgi:2-keto-4-pentenoate hydratase/2-oxohepta-3-ene-1,7-dioic acid hydratase in catechol pathway
MKLLSFAQGGRQSFGIVTDEGVVDLGRRMAGRHASLQDLIAASGLKEAEAHAGAAPDYKLGEIEFLPVVSHPDKIIALQLNYRAHIEELKESAFKNIPVPDKYPSFFFRTRGSHVGHLQPVVRPKVSDSLDYEGELAVIIGRRCRHVTREQALSCVAGYACYNEGSVREWQMRAPQITTGKIFERSGSFGPWMVTADQIPDPAALHLQTRVNGEVRQDSGVADLLFDVPTMISYFSAICELHPGDVIATGTPGRVGGFAKLSYLQPGDLVEVEISGIGTLVNPVIAE